MSLGKKTAARLKGALKDRQWLLGLAFMKMGSHQRFLSMGETAERSTQIKVTFFMGCYIGTAERACRDPFTTSPSEYRSDGLHLTEKAMQAHRGDRICLRQIE